MPDIVEYAEDTRFLTTPAGHPVRMIYRQGTNDWNTLTASLTEDEYLLPTGLSGVAFDIGGYLGSVGIGLALDNPDLRVYIVEPVPPNADLIERNIEANGLGDRVTLIRGAVGRGGESVDVWYGYRGNENALHHAFVGNNSLAYTGGGEVTHDTITYTALGLADLVNLVDVERYGPYTDAGGPAETHPAHDPILIDYLKIDTEGAEWAFLTSPELHRVKTIVGEWHPTRSQTIGEFRALLDDTHLVTFSGPQTGPGGFAAVRRA